MRLGPLLAILLLLSGCTTTGPNATPTPDGPSDASLQAPWWNVGESWTIRFTQGGGAQRTTTLVNFANNSFNDPPHFWLGTADRDEALDHVFFDNNPFLGRIHWEILAPHEKGMHSAMYVWPLEDGRSWTSPILFDHEDILVEAHRNDDGTFSVNGASRADGTSFDYDYDPTTRWFRHLSIGGGSALEAEVIDHRDSGARGTYHFLRGRDYLDADGGTTGEEEPFTVKEEGATSIAFLLDVRTGGPAAIEFVDPSGAVVHRETLTLTNVADKIVEIDQHPTPGEWKLRYVGNVQGTILVRGIIAYKGTL